MEPDSLKLKGLRKEYGRVLALEEVNLHVRQGEVYGFLGRNGAGKTTTIRLIMGISKATSGSMELFGEPLHHDAIHLRQRIGYVAQEHHFYDWMTPDRLGQFLAGFYPTWDADYYRQLVDNFALPHNRKIEVFSGGMKAKIALATALAHRPPLLLLDEPTAGLDPVARHEFLEIIQALSEQPQQTIFFSSHLIDEVELVADRIGIIDKGRMLYEGQLAPLVECNRCLTHNVPQDRWDEAAQATFGAAELKAAGGRILQQKILKGTHKLIVQMPSSAHWAQLQLPETWSLETMSLEDVFIAMVSEQITGPSLLQEQHARIPPKMPPPTEDVS